MFRRIFEIILAILALALLSPIIIVVALLIKLSGKGSVIFRQDRVGLNGASFMIYKFRSMVADAEIGEPQLTGANDPRVTPIGSFIRRYRIDEIPNLINVIKGDMQIVGPRPERQKFIDQIVRRDSRYLRLLKTKPGLTSWGQVNYGYASDVNQMLERMEFDLYFLEQKSIIFEIKIALLTFITIFKGKGI